METNVSKTIYRDFNSNGNSRVIFYEIKNGQVSLCQHDMGPACELFYGDYEYERIISGIELEKLMTLLCVGNIDEFMSKMKNRFGFSYGLDLFSTFLEENDIKYQYYYC